MGLRSASSAIGYKLSARMPLTYVHLVQVLVDTLTLLAPFALFAKFGVASVLLNGLIVSFYQGLLNLCKSFLDPFDGRSFEVPVFVKEQIAASTFWLNEGEAVFNEHDT